MSEEAKKVDSVKASGLYVLLRRLKRTLAQKSVFKTRARHTIQITSYGGVGTSFFYDFLELHGIDVSKEPYHGKWKHQPCPPDSANDNRNRVKAGFRAIYLFGNPMNAMISVFNRNLQLDHLDATGNDPTQWVSNMTLDEFLERGIDEFRLEEHFTNWTTCPKQGRSYPIMLLRYETMWNYLPEVFSFLGVPFEHLSSFPEKRNRSSNWEDLDDSKKKLLLKMYGDLAKRIDESPDISVI